MFKYDIVLFDFDGTLVDTGEGITKSIKYALECMGIKEESYANLRRFIGPPLYDSFKEFYSFDEAQIQQAVKKYRERYNKKCVEESCLYPKTEEMLKTLKAAGVRTAIASTKPTHFVERIADALNISQYFNFISASELSGQRSGKKELIEYALENLGARGNERVAMVGDRYFDAAGAKQCGVDFFGVLFGYGTKEEFEREGYTALCGDNDELLAALSE